MRTITCKNMGVDCPWEGEANTLEELIDKVKEHAKKDHPDMWKDKLSKMSEEELHHMIDEKAGSKMM